MSLYRNIFKKALHASWNNKYLWFFGIFATLLGSSGGSEVVLRSSSGDAGNDFISGFYQYKEAGVFKLQTIENFFNLFRTDFVSMISLLFLFLLSFALVLFFVWLAVVSQAAIIDGAAESFSKKKNKKTIKDGVTVGNDKFWPVLGLNIIIKVVMLLVLMVVSQMFILAIVFSSSWLTVLLSVVLFVVFFLFSIFFAMVMKYAIAFVVIKNKKIIDSIKEGWQLFVSNWLVSVEMAISLFFIVILAGIAISLSVLVLIIPFIFLGIVFFELFSFFGLWFVAITGFLILLALIIWAGSFLTVFTTSAWTGLFIELINKRGISKIIRLTERFQK